MSWIFVSIFDQLPNPSEREVFFEVSVMEKLVYLDSQTYISEEPSLRKCWAEPSVKWLPGMYENKNLPR